MDSNLISSIIVDLIIIVVFQFVFSPLSLEYWFVVIILGAFSFAMFNMESINGPKIKYRIKCINYKTYIPQYKPRFLKWRDFPGKTEFTSSEDARKFIDKQRTNISYINV